MEFFICRALEVGRLTEEQLIKLETHERNIHRCLTPPEIQESLNLPTLKEAYQIPEHEVSQSQYNMQIRSKLRANYLVPNFGDFSISDVEKIHAYDKNVKALTDTLALEFTFQGGKSKRRISEDLE